MSLYDDPATGLDSFGGDEDHLAPPPAEDAGLGSLADELAGAYDEDSDGYDGEEGEGEGEGGEGGAVAGTGEAVDGEAAAVTGDTGPPTPSVSSPASPSKAASRAGTVRGKHVRPPSISDYDGSDYGDPEDLVESGISFGLEDKLTQIERLALTNKMMLREDQAATNGVGGGEEAGAVPRLMEGLQKLLPQSTLEAGSSRLITAHSALASHMVHQTRTLRDLAFSINNSPYLPPPETSDLLLSLIDLIPRPSLQPQAELSSLHNLTLSLISQLSFLSDSLHMARQSSIAANRKLRVAKEACADWKNELEAVEKARRWIEDGDWDERCKRREAADVCREVIGGFEGVCEGFEEKLRALSVGA